MVAINPVELIFGTYRREVLALLLLRPEERYYVREIARLTGIVPGSLHRELKLLAAAGLLVRQQRGNQVVYFANTESPIYAELAAIFRKMVEPTLFDPIMPTKIVEFEPQTLPTFDPQSVKQLFAAAQRNLVDAGVSSISLGLRFDAAYKALMQAALVLMVISNAQPSRVNNAILSLVSAEKLEALDALRRRRSHADYGGAPVSMVATDACILDARELIQKVKAFLQDNHPDCL
ncbi:MAG TPA: hypothetical protein VIR78_01860 [Malonomonas sp.]